MNRFLLGLPLLGLSLLGSGFTSSCSRRASEEAPAATSAPDREETESKKTSEDDAEKSDAPGLEGAPRPQAAPPQAAPAPAHRAEEERKRSGGLPSQQEQTIDTLSLEQASEALQAAFSEVEAALELSTPDCTSAKTLRDRVCDLAEHICRLADESAAPSAQRLCEDGKERCGQAKGKFDATCASP